MRGQNLEGVRAKQSLAQTASRSRTEPEEYGEVAGGGGGVPYLVCSPAPAQIRRVTVWHRQYVDGIQLETDEGVLPRIGATGKHHDIHQDSFELAPDEFITGLFVEYWNYIDRITFHTNKRSYGPYGGSGGRITKELK